MAWFEVGYIPADAEPICPLNPGPEPWIKLGDPDLAKTVRPRECLMWRNMFIFGLIVGFVSRGVFPKEKKT